MQRKVKAQRKLPSAEDLSHRSVADAKFPVKWPWETDAFKVAQNLCPMALNNLGNEGATTGPRGSRAG